MLMLPFIQTFTQLLTIFSPSQAGATLQPAQGIQMNPFTGAKKKNYI